MKLSIFGWNRHRKKLFLLFLCSLSIFVWGLFTTVHIQLYNRQLLQNKFQFSNVKDIFEIAPVDQSNSLRYNVKDIKNIMPEIRPRAVQNVEQQLFRKEKLDIIVNLQKNNWIQWEERYCMGNLYNFKGSFVLMTDVVIDPSKKSSKAKGGEEIQSVIGHSEQDEEVSLQNGFFNLLCQQIPKITFPKKSHFTKWFSGLSTSNIYQKDVHSEDFPFTVLIKRGDYANLYWTLIELYNTFLTVRLFNENPKTTTVILMDAHPVGKLDNLWRMVFGNVYRIGRLSQKTFHKKLAWVIRDGPMALSVKTIPFVEEFKFALYQSINNSSSLYHECSSNDIVQNVTFILRKNYVAHPRNPGGKVNRKLSNEKELINYLTNKLPEARITAVQIDLFPIEEQIKLIYETNVLVGVHGAGLGHTLILRSRSTMVELFPSSYKRTPNPHFQMFAYWADVHYDRWFSTSPPIRNNEWLYVDPEAAYKLIKHALDKSCKH